jgi:hypothetical protein
VPASRNITVSYASAARRALYGQQASAGLATAIIVETGAKPVPSRHKREIIVARGKETAAELARSNKEIIKQLNTSAGTGEAVALRRLPSGDLLLTLDSENARNAWLRDNKWLVVLGEGVRIKRRAFIILAHGMRLSQVQNPASAIREIYRQNPALQGKVDIIRVAWQKRLLRSGRTTGPLYISVAEPEQANSLIEAGLI